MTKERLPQAITRLAEIMARLRRECPWDRRQSHASLRRYLLEETHEVLEALDRNDLDALREELGDLLFQIWFHAEIASEDTQRGFDLAAVLEGITDKLVRRHPHVFGDARADDAAAVKRNWERLKRAEGRSSALDGVPRELPALLASTVLQEKAAAVDFDWPSHAGVAEKIREELDELLTELDALPEGVKPAELDDAARRRLDQEYGDLLAALVNYGRHLGLSAEDSLREANRRFELRFRAMEARARERGRELAGMSLDEMEALWQEAKKQIDESADEGGGRRTGVADGGGRRG